MSSFKRSRPIIRLSISKWQRSTLAVMTARLIMSSVWGAVGFSACVDVAALRLIATAARVAFFMAWFSNSALVICNDCWQKIRRDWLDMRGTSPLALAVGLIVLRESSRDQIDLKHIWSTDNHQYVRI